MFSEKELNLQESELREQIRALSSAELSVYHRLEEETLKNPALYLQLNWLFPLGVHHFYLERWLRGTINLVLTVMGAWLALATELRWYGVLMLIAVVLIEVPQLLNARLLVRNRNNQIMQTCLQSARREQHSEVSGP